MSSSHAHWQQLCDLIDDDPQLWPSVRQALEAPAEYLADRSDALEMRGIEDPADVTPWLALIDGLDDAGALAYLDWKDTGVELADALVAVPRIVSAGVDVDEVGDVDGEIPEAAVRADQLLAPSGLRLVHLDEDSDAYPLVVVPTAGAEQIVALAATVGQKAQLFG